MTRALRPYQVESVDAVEREWTKQRSTLLVLATGTGKTFTASEIIRRRADRGLVLWLAHREELLTQARDAIVSHTGLSVGIEKAEQRASVDALWGVEDRVVVASVQTLAGAKRRARFDASRFATVIVDEAHHATAKSYRQILADFPDAQVLGLTATPDRGDDVGLGAVFESVAYRYEIRRAIREGYLCPITQKTVECGSLDLSSCRTTAGDLNQGDLEKALRVDEVLHQIAGPLVREAGDRPTIVFTVSVEQAHALADVLAGYTQSLVRAVDGNTPVEVRRRYLHEFATGQAQFILNCGVLTEGFDAPRTACVAVARPTKSRALYAQMIGRGTRLFEGKPDCLVLDFVGNAGKHTLVTPLDVLAGKPIPDDVAKAAKEKTDAGMPSEEALAQAEREAIERAEREERERARKAKLQAETAYRARTIDPFGVCDTRDSTGPRASEAQLEYLKNVGIDVKGTPSAREASKMLDEVKRRRRENLCSPRQMKTLRRAGLDPRNIGFEEASGLIDRIAGNSWRAPADMLAKYAPRSEAAE